MKLKFLPKGVLLLLLTQSIPAFAECLEEAVKFSKDICGELSKKGGIKSLQGSGEVKGEAGGIIKRFVGGVEGSVSANALLEEYSNVLREDLANDVLDTRSCRQKMAIKAIELCTQSASQNNSSNEAPPAHDVSKPNIKLSSAYFLGELPKSSVDYDGFIEKGTPLFYKIEVSKKTKLEFTLSEYSNRLFLDVMTKSKNIRGRYDTKGNARKVNGLYLPGVYYIRLTCYKGASPFKLKAEHI